MEKIFSNNVSSKAFAFKIHKEQLILKTIIKLNNKDSIV